MFTLVQADKGPPRRWAERLTGRWRQGFSVTCHQNPRYLVVTFLFPMGGADKLSLRQTERGMAFAAEKGSVGVVLPREFPFPELPGQFHMAVSTPVPLLRRLCGPICFYAADQMGIPKRDLRVALVGRRFTHEMSGAAQFLAVRARSLQIGAGRDTAAACHGLRSATGLAATGLKLKPCDIYAFFDVPEKALPVPEHALCLNFSGGAPAVLGGVMADGALLRPPRTLWKDWPDGCDTEALLSALCAQGSVAASEIGIRGLCRGAQTLTLGSGGKNVGGNS